jgi:uncharacterized protein YbgA (DUF1722 family)
VDRKRLLDEIGFVWKPGNDHLFKPDDKLWHEQYQKLVEFKRKTGHCIVPSKYEQDKSLGKWVGNQQQRHAKNKMRPHRSELLDRIGFAWKYDGDGYKPNDKSWRQQYEKVVEFKQKYGHCLVPYKYEQDKSLGRWVSSQRQCHAKNKMRPQRKRSLDDIGFSWKALAAPSSPMNVRGLVIGTSHALGRS